MKKSILLLVVSIGLIALIFIWFYSVGKQEVLQSGGEYWRCVTNRRTGTGPLANITCNSDDDCSLDNARNFCDSREMGLPVPLCLSFDSYCGKEKICMVRCK